MYHVIQVHLTLKNKELILELNIFLLIDIFGDDAGRVG